MSERYVTCRSCNTGAWHPVERRGDVPIGAWCAFCGKALFGDTGRAMSANVHARTWEGAESMSNVLAFQREGVADIKRDCPSAEFVPDPVSPGSVRMAFKGDRHQRQVYREMNSAMERYKHEAQQAGEAR